MRRASRWLAFVVLVVLVTVGALASAATGLVRQSFPQVEGRLTLAGLTAPVEVLRDGSGVPHIYADNAEDLFEAQGFVHAQDRFYEMDFRRHLAAGRLSELYGASQVETDTFVRTLGWRRTAEQEVALLSSSTRRYLEAYAAGVNSYLRGKIPAELSLEYRFLRLQGLRYTPEPWTPADSLSWLKVMAWDLASNLEQETDRALLATKVGQARAGELFPPQLREGFDPILGRGAVVDERFRPEVVRSAGRPLPAGLGEVARDGAAQALRDTARAWRALPEVLGAGGEIAGSNSWVIAGSRTASGAAILGNDPHLRASIPSTFAQVGLHCRALSQACPFDVSGFSLAAVPGVTIGKNTRIAWGLTTSYVDVQDLYLEQLAGDTVREGDRFVPLTVRTEQVRVRGEEQPRTVTVRSTRHGPLLSDVTAEARRIGTERAGPPNPAYGVSLAWAGAQPGRTLEAVLGLNRAGTFEEFRAAAQLLAAPSQNLVYADVDGNIGYQLPGTVPVRARGDGRTVSPGWDTGYDWRGTVPFREMPYAYNPPEGFLVTANQPVVGRQYRRPLGSAYSYGWRSQEPRDRLAEAPPLTLDDAEQLFYDDTVRAAADIVPALLRVTVADPWVAEGQQTLVGWDYSAAADSAAAAYFHLVVTELLAATFRDELGEDLAPTSGDRGYAVLTELLADRRNAWWDDVTTPQVEDRDDVLLTAMTQARKRITALLARDADQWQWGRLHQAHLRNQTLGSSGFAPVEALFNRGRYPVAGGPAVVNAMAFDDRTGYQVYTAPTMRMLVDLGDLDASRWVNQTGVSGHAFAAHYDDQTERWATNRTWAFVSSRPAVEAATVDRLALVPDG